MSYSESAQPTLDVGAAISYGWNKFKANALVWVVMSLVAILLSGFVSLAPRGFSFDPDASTSAGAIIGALLSGLIGIFVQAAYTRGALDELDGRRPTFGDFLKWNNVSNLIVAAVLVWIIEFVGLVLCIIPGLIAAFLLWYTFAFVIDRDEPAVDALKSSYQLTSKNVGSLLLLAIALFFLNVATIITCGIALLVTMPITILASVYAYRLLTGGVVSDAA